MIDLFGGDFVLVRFAPDAETGALADAASQRGVPLEVVDIDNQDAAALYEKRLVLVRPDGHIAWRGDALPDDALGLIDRVRGG